MHSQHNYNVRRPLKDLSSEEFVLGVEPVIEISLSDRTPKTNSSELRSLSGRLTLYGTKDYRVGHLIVQLGFVDLDLGCSTILLGQ